MTEIYKYYIEFDFILSQQKYLNICILLCIIIIIYLQIREYIIISFYNNKLFIFFTTCCILGWATKDLCLLCKANSSLGYRNLDERANPVDCFKISSTSSTVLAQPIKSVANCETAYKRNETLRWQMVLIDSVKI